MSYVKKQSGPASSELQSAAEIKEIVDTENVVVVSATAPFACSHAFLPGQDAVLLLKSLAFLGWCAIMVHLLSPAIIAQSWAYF